MSGINSKSSKVDRALRRIVEISDQSATIEQLSNSLHLAAETAYRLEQENARLRKYLGSVLFQRRQREAWAIPTLGDPLDLNPAYVPSRLPNVKMEI